eukprot:7274043-Karenia_brevis.AAC.1
MRSATRKYRAATGKFGPRNKFQKKKFGQRFTKKGPKDRFGRPSRGFFIGQTFVSLDHVPDESIN